MKKKILFVLDGSPNNNNAGGLLVHKIVKEYGIDYFRFISIGSIINIHDLPRDILGVYFKNYSLRFPMNKYIFRIFKKIPFLETIYVYLKLAIYTSKIIKYSKKQECELIFTILRGDCLLILNKLVNSMNIPLIGFDTDTIEAEFNDHKIIYMHKKRIFYMILNKFSSMATIGETMREYYKEKFGINSIILRLPYKKFTENQMKIIKKDINIIFLGNLYSKDELIKFLLALDIFASGSKGFNFNIFIATHKPLKINSKSLNIINLGWLSEDDLCNYLKICHISYLPYKFDKRFEHQMKYAFPNKAGLYITNNLPIFFHGPQYSSFNAFLKKYKVGVNCASLENEDIISTFRLLINDSKFYTNCQNECKRAHENEFSGVIFSNKIRELFEGK